MKKFHTNINQFNLLILLLWYYCNSGPNTKHFRTNEKISISFQLRFWIYRRFVSKEKEMISHNKLLSGHGARRKTERKKENSKCFIRILHLYEDEAAPAFLCLSQFDSIAWHHSSCFGILLLSLVGLAVCLLAFFFFDIRLRRLCIGSSAHMWPFLSFNVNFILNLSSFIVSTHSHHWFTYTKKSKRTLLDPMDTFVVYLHLKFVWLFLSLSLSLHFITFFFHKPKVTVFICYLCIISSSFSYAMGFFFFEITIRHSGWCAHWTYGISMSVNRDQFHFLFDHIIDLIWFFFFFCCCISGWISAAVCYFFFPHFL